MKIIQFLSRPLRWAVLFSFLLAGLFSFALLDTFVIPKALVSVEPSASSQTSTFEAEQPEAGQTSEVPDDSTAVLSTQDSDIIASDQSPVTAWSSTIQPTAGA